MNAAAKCCFYHYHLFYRYYHYQRQPGQSSIKHEDNVDA